ncbi:MAG: Ig-like domain-containing protein [Brevundimonas sp.]
MMRLGVALAALLMGLLLAVSATPAAAQETVTYGYDALGRVAWVSYGNGQTTRYDYDAAGNRLVVQTATSSGGFPPMAENDYAETRRGQTVQIYVRTNDFDANGATFTVTARTTPTSGTATIAAGGTHITYVAPNTFGDFTFDYTITNSFGGTDTASVLVHVMQGQAYCNQFPDDPWC